MGNHNTTITSSKSSNQIQIKSLSSSMKRSKTTNSISQNSQQAAATTTTTTNTTLGCFKCNSKTNNFNKINNNEDEQEHLGGMLASSVSDLLAESTNIFTKFRNRLKKSNIRVKSTPSSAYTINPVVNSQPDHTAAADVASVEIPRRSETDYNINLISSSSNNDNNNNHHTKNSNKEIKLLSRTFAVHDFKDKALNEDETKRVSDLEEHESLSSYELNDENASLMNTQSESLCYIDQEEDTCTNCSSSSYSSSNSTSTSVSLSSLNFLNQVNQKLYSHLNTTPITTTTITNINNTNFNFNINNNFDLLEFSNDNITLYNNFVNCPFYSISKSRNYNYDEKRAPLADSETFTLSGSQSCLNYSIKRIRL